MSDPGGPGIIRSLVDPRYECVPLGTGSPDGRVSQPPPGDVTTDEAVTASDQLPRLCPEGYVPRRRRPPYASDGKVVHTGAPPLHNEELP